MSSQFNHDDYIYFRIKKAEETLFDAEILAREGRWNSSMNRLYYACFYAVLALLSKHRILTRTHSGVKTQFGLKFILTGSIEKKMGSLLFRYFCIKTERRLCRLHRI